MRIHPLLLALALPSLCLGAQQDKLLPLGPPAAHEFGSGISINGDWAAVGAPNGGGGTTNHLGRVQIYQSSSAGWVHTTDLVAPDTSDAYFGEALSLDGGRLAVGAPYTDLGGTMPSPGAVYVYSDQSGGWAFLQKLYHPSPGGWGSEFGSSVDIEGNLLAVGEQNRASCVVFQDTGSGYTPLAEVNPPINSTFQFYGHRVALAGNRLAVSAPEGVEFSSPGGGSGTVYIYVLVGASYTLEATINSSDGQSQDRFGSDIDFDGDTLIVGASHWGPQASRPFRTGAVYTYARSGSTWTETGIIPAPPSAYPQEFGIALDRDGDRLLVGAPAHHPDPWNSDFGKAFLYEDIGSSWSLIQDYTAYDAQDDDLFGWQLAFDKGRALVGAPREDEVANKAGATYPVYPFATSYCQCMSPMSCGNQDFDAGCTNTTGSGAHLFARGSGSVTGDDLTFSVIGLPPNQNALMFMGGGTPFGGLLGGLRCVGSGGVGLYRMPLHNSGSGGAFQEGPGVVAWSQNLPPAGRIQPGQTWYFQCYYRDIVGGSGSCGLGGNLSDALEVVFAP